MADTLAEYGINQAGNTEIQDELANYVKKCFSQAQAHRRNMGIDERMLNNLRANKLQYKPDEINLLGVYNNIYIGIPALKARAAESWIIDIILNNIEKPWALTPTTDPSLPEDAREEIVDTLLQEIGEFQNREALQDRAKQLKAAFIDMEREKAEQANKRMEQTIQDQTEDSDWVIEFNKLIQDITVQPTCVMRGMYVTNKLRGKWDGNKYVVEPQPTPNMRCIPAFDAYPAPNATDTTTGSYFLERLAQSPADLYDLIGVEGFNAGNIRQVLDKYEDCGFSLALMGDSERRWLENQSQDGTVTSVITNLGMIDTLIFNGKVKGKQLADHGVIVKDKQKWYEAEVWLCGDYVIRAVLNPYPTGARPIQFTSYRKIRGSFWGQSVVDLVMDCGRVCNAAARAITRNMGYSSGPVGEVDSSRTAETQDPTSIEPYVIKFVGPDLQGSGAAAYRFHNITNISADLMAVIERFIKLADDLSGVPSYVLGNPNVAGAGRTLGGLSMLMGNAAKGIKTVQKNIDIDIVAPLIKRFYEYNMLTSNDPSIKADSDVVARGATGLMQRELAQTRTVEILQIITPFLENWDNLPDGIKILLREVLKTSGLPVDKIIPDPEAGANTQDLRELLTRGIGPAMARGAGAPQPLPPQSLPPNVAQFPPQAAPQLPNIPTPVNMPTGA